MLRTCSLTLLLLAGALPGADSAYLVPVIPGAVIRPIASSGDLLPAGVDATGVAVGGGATKAVVGVLDGLGAFDNGDGTFTLLANQELGSTKGAVRAHGQAGAFVSRWTINSSSLAVSTLADQITTIYHFNPGSGLWATTPTAPFTAPIDRFCSADLPATAAFYNSGSGLGLPPGTGRLFMNGEETTNGRAFAHAVSGAYAGQSVQLPHIGVAAWENLVACPYPQDLTIVAATDDTTPGQVYIYVGSKQNLGTLPSPTGTAQDWARAAGLVGGSLYTVIGNGQLNEQRTGETGFVGVGAGKGVALRFGLAQVNTPANVAAYTSGATMDARTALVGGTYFWRPEDAVWDPIHPDTLYFLTTDRFDTVKNGGTGAASPTIGRSRLWRLRFDDIANPTAGGAITMLIDGSEDPGPQMMDNMTMDRFGRILIQEDPGNAEHASAIWLYDTATGSLRKVAKHDPSRFGDRGYGASGVDGALTTSVAPFDGDTTTGAAVPGRSDEESSGIVDAQDILGPGWFLLDVQAHSSTGMDATTVERGQLLAMYVPFTQASGGTFQAGNLATIAYPGTSAYGVSALPVRDSGMGSAMAPVPGQPGQFWCMTDRGPNANAAWLSATTKVFPKPTFSPNLRRVQLNGDGTMTVLQQIAFKRSDGTTPITGLPLPTGTNGSTNEDAFAVNADGSVGATLLSDTSGLDSEGLVAAPDGTFWVSDEYGPFICHFDATGVEIERCSPFAAGAVSGIKLPSVLRNREINRGMEGLAMSPDGTKLVGIMQSPLANSTTTSGGIPAGSGAGQSRRMLATRIVEITIATGAVREFPYITDTRSTAINEIIAVSNTRYLVLERDGNFPSSGSTVKKVYAIDLTTATDIHDAADGVNGKIFTTITPLPGGAVAGSGTMEDIIRLIGTSPSVSQATLQLSAIGVTPLTKTLVVDLTSYKALYNHDKVEGMALVGSTLYVINDDDFGVTDDDQEGLTNSALTPVLSKTVVGTVTTQNVNGTPVKSGLQDYTQILQVDLSAIGSTVLAPNFSPSLAVGSTLAVAVGATGDAAVTVGDVETPAASLTVTAASGTTTVATAAITGSGAARTLTVTGVAPGVATVTVSVSDGTNTTSSTVAVTVTGSGGGSSGGTPSSSDSNGCGAGTGAVGLLVALLGLMGLRRRRQ